MLILLPLQMFDDPFFKKKFFGEEFSNQFKQNRVQRSLGSGVIVTKDGYIVTKIIMLLKMLKR